MAGKVGTRNHVHMEKTAAHMPGDLNRLRRETDMLAATVDSLRDDEMAAPSLAEGWTRSHIVAHLAGNARAITRLAEWAVSGEEQSMYPSRESRDAEIEELAALPPAELKRVFHDANAALDAALQKMQNGTVAATALHGPPGEFSAYQVPTLRMSEVLIHHLDLDTAWGLDEADMDALEDTLEMVMGRITGREDWPGLTIETDEGEQYVLGDGTTHVTGGRDAILGWITRGITTGVRCDAELPGLPAYA